MSILWTLWSIFVIFMWCFGGKLAADKDPQESSKIWTAVGVMIVVSVILPSIMFLMVI